MSSSREQIIEAASQLIETQGYHATGLNQIIQESGAPKGSLYYYFPEGKEELASEAVQHTGKRVTERIRSTLDASSAPAEAVRRFILTVAHHVAASEYRAGGPITTVALESAVTSPRINAACQEVYATWRQAFAEKLIEGGLTPRRSHRLAALIISALEGAIVLSRTEHSPAPLEAVAEEIAALLQCTTPSS
jgi:TetR/AcrR family transcriptional repressor of lmrAB and yxaGH operons